jgi:hypothetical protein
VHKRLVLAAVTFVAAAMLPSRAGADVAIVGLPHLIAQSTHIVIGTCRQVEPLPDSGRLLVTIDVEQPLRGAAPPTILLDTNARETEGPTWNTGARRLLFLRSREARDLGASSQREVVFDAVGRAAGIFAIGHESLIEPTADIVRRALAASGRIGLSAFRDALLRTGSPPARRLVMALLEGSDVSTVSDRALLVDLACDTADTYAGAAQLWGIARAGRLHLAAARRCLEAVAAQDADRGRRLSAIGALGDLGDSRSVPMLLAFVGSEPTANPDVTDPSRDGDLVMAAALALGKTRAAVAVAALGRLAQQSPDLALHSTVVHALGLIASADAQLELTRIASSHPHPLVRDQAERTRAALDQPPARRIP